MEQNFLTCGGDNSHLGYDRNELAKRFNRQSKLMNKSGGFTAVKVRKVKKIQPLMGV